MPDAIDIKKINFKTNGVGGQTDKLNEIIRRTFLSRAMTDDEINKLGIKHVRGILLHGPPGCGKTLIAKTIGKMLNCATTTMISGTELLSKWMGDSEENVRNLFKKSKNEPNKLHLIIIDELDAIAKSRENFYHGSSGTSERVVNEFLASIDGPKSLNNFIIIGMTNFKDSLDKALLRPGRLEVHIKIDLPTKEDVLDILEIHTKHLKLNKLLENINFKSMSEILTGYTGAEIEGVIKAAVSRAMERYINDKNKTSKLIVKKINSENDKKDKIIIKKIDFDNAIKYDIKPMYRGIDEKLIEMKNTKFVCWNDELKSIYSSILTKLKSVNDEECYKLYIRGKKYSGKFTMAVDLCNKLKYDCIRFISPYNLLNIPNVTDKIKYICEKFDQAQTAKFGIIIVQDFNRVIESIENNYNMQLLNTFMILLKKQIDKDKKTVIIFTGELPVNSLQDLFDNDYELKYEIENDNSFKNILKKLSMPYNDKTKKITNVKELFSYKKYYSNLDNESSDSNSSSEESSTDEDNEDD